MSAREDALKIYRAAMEAVRPERLIEESCRLKGEMLRIGTHTYDLSRYRRLFLFGSGKAAWPMAKALESMLGDRIAPGGVVVVPVDLGALEHVEVLEGSHPIPDDKSLKAAQRLQEAMAQCGKEDLYLYLLSGGSSALIEAPIAPITLEDLRETTRLMLENGLAIGSVNTVRKHISTIKGGRLGAACAAEGAVLVVSDVIGNDLEAIGSAPLYCDRTTYADAKRVLERAGIFEALPPSVRDVIEAGCGGSISESPKEPSGRIRHILIGSNETALGAAAAEAAALGYNTTIVPEPLEGDADRLGPKLVAYARAASDDVKRCIVYGGETTVEVKGRGKGGRNQQLCLSALASMEAVDGMTLLCAGTDGIDGNSDAAGAVVGPETLEAYRREGLSPEAYLRNNDAYAFFERCDALVVTGPSGTNVMDVTILITGG